MNTAKLKKAFIVFLSFTLVLGAGFTFGGNNVQAEVAPDPRLKVPNWSIASGEPLITVTDTVGDSTSLRFEARDIAVDTANPRTDIYSSHISAEAGKTYTVTADVFMEEQVSHSFAWYMVPYNAEGQALTNTQEGFRSSEFTVGQWNEITLVRTMPADTATVRIRMYTGDPTTMVAYIDNVKLSVEEADGSQTPIVVPNGDFEAAADEGDPGSGSGEENPPVEQYPVQIENPYFNQFQVPGWRVEDPSGGPYVTSARAYSGQQSLKFIALNGNNTDVRSRLISVQGGLMTELNAKVFMEENVSSGTTFGWYILSYDSNGNQLESHRVGLAASSFTVGEWNDVAISRAIPAGTANVQIRLYTGGATTMVAYVDDVQMAQMDGESTIPVGLDNAGFEEAVTVDNWDTQGGSFLVSSQEAYSGLYSLEIHRTGDTQLNLSSNRVGVTPGTTYYASAQYWAHDSHDNGALTLSFYNAEDQLLDASEAALTDAAAEAWTLAVVEQEAPAGAAYAVVGLKNEGMAHLHLYIDAVQLSVEEPDGGGSVDPFPSTFTNAGFEEAPGEDAGIPGWTVRETHADSTLAVTDEIAKNGSYSLYFHDNNENAGLRVQSDPVAASSGFNYIVGVEAYIVYQSHRIVLELEFFDRNAQLLHKETSLFNNLPTEVWTTLPVSALAPNGTSYATLSFYSGGISYTEVYFDDVTLREVQPEIELETPQLGAPVPVGQPVTVPLAQGGQIRATAEGNNEVYMVSNGDPAVFHALNAETGELLFQQSLRHGDETVWAMTFDLNGDLYFASDSTGILYKYEPLVKEMSEIGRIPTGDTKVWDLTTTADGMIYGGTYPGASVFGYNPVNGEFRNYGRVHPTEQYVRGIAADDEYIYAAIGSTKHLIQIDRETGERQELIIQSTEYPDHQSGVSGFYSDVWVMKGKLLIQSGASTIIVVDPDTLQIEQRFAVSDQISPPSPTNPELIYYKNDEDLFTYNFADNTVTKLQGLPPLPDTPRVKSLEWITLKEGPRAGRTVLAATTQYSEYFIYDPMEHEIEIIELQVEPQAVNIQSIEVSPDNKLYIGGFQRGLSILDPTTDEVLKTFGIFRQAEGIGFKDNVAYFGTYTGAQIYRYDPSQPDNFGPTPLNNPGYVFKMESEQDRPFAVASGDHYVFLGSTPNYGVLGGALAVYNEQTDTWNSYRNVVQNQSIIGLAYRDGLLYGGTSVWGGQGGSPSESEAKMFIWDAEAGVKLDEFTLDIPDIDQAPKMIGALSFGPDGLLWGAIDGTIFAMDAGTKEIVKSKVILPSTYSSSKWNPHYLRWGPDGLLYTTLSRKLVVIDPETLQYKVFNNLGTVHNMTVTADGSVYYADSASTLYKLPSLVEYPDPNEETPQIPTPGNGGFIPQPPSGIDQAIERIKNSQGNAQVVLEAIHEALDSLLALQDAHQIEKDAAGHKVAGLKNGAIPQIIQEWKTSREALRRELAAQGLDDTALVQYAPVLTIAASAESNGAAGLLLTANELRLLNDEAIGLSLQLGLISMNLTPGLLAAEQGELLIISSPEEAVVIEQHMDKFRELQSNYSVLSYAGGMYNFEVFNLLDGKLEEAAAFNGKIRVTLPAGEAAAAGDNGLTAVYRYLPQSEAWQYVGGTMTDGAMQFETPHFSTYAILRHYRTFADIEGHWAQASIEQLAAMQIARGMSEVSFAPSQQLTKAQFAAWLTRALQLEEKEYAGVFQDVAAADWYASEVQAAFDAGIISGYNGRFMPEQAITREEMATMAMAAWDAAAGHMAKQDQEGQVQFKDENKVSSWAQSAVSRAAAAGIIRGMGDGRFAPQDVATRAQAIVIIEQLLAGQ